MGFDKRTVFLRETLKPIRIRTEIRICHFPPSLASHSLLLTFHFSQRVSLVFLPWQPLSMTRLKKRMTSARSNQNPQLIHLALNRRDVLVYCRSTTMAPWHRIHFIAWPSISSSHQYQSRQDSSEPIQIKKIPLHPSQSV